MVYYSNDFDLGSSPSLLFKRPPKVNEIVDVIFAVDRLSLYILFRVISDINQEFWPSVLNAIYIALLVLN